MRIVEALRIKLVKRVAFCTFGCRLNAYDTETVRTLLEKEGGWQTVGLREEADLYVVNTCSVTTQADASARKAIRRINKQRPDARIVVTGCYAQRAPQDIAELAGVSLIVGAADRGTIADQVEASVHGQLKISVSPIEQARTFLDVPITEMMERSRALIKVQEGCDQSCTFCIVPQTRGRSRSRLPERVFSQARGLVDAGYTEIVLTGVHIGAYGLDLENTDCGLTELIAAVLRTPGLERLRLSSIEPASIDEELIELMATEPKFARHFHIPFQSGSNEILERMQRGYRAEQFEELVTNIAGRIPDCGIGTDVIAGFPGESDEHFARTFEVLERLPVTYLHPFTYSVRPGSTAEAFGDQVSGDVKKRRTRSLKRLSKEKSEEFKNAHLCRTMPVLLELDDKTNTCPSGWTDNYLKVHVTNPAETPGIYSVHIDSVDDSQTLGTRLS